LGSNILPSQVLNSLYMEEFKADFNKLFKTWDGRILDPNQELDTTNRVAIHNWLNGRIDDAQLKANPNGEFALKVGQAMQKVYQSDKYKEMIALNRYNRWRKKDIKAGGAVIPGVNKVDLAELKALEDAGDMDAFLEKLNTTKGFLIDGDYAPDYDHARSQELSAASFEEQATQTAKLKGRTGEKTNIQQDAVRNFLKHLEVHGQAMFMEDALMDFYDITNMPNWESGLRADLQHMVKSVVTPQAKDPVSRFVSGYVGMLMRASLSMPTKYARNSFQRLTLLPYVALRDLPKFALQIAKHSFGRVGNKQMFGIGENTFANAPAHVKTHFLSMVSGEGGLNEDYFHLHDRDVLDKIPVPGVGPLIRRYIQTYIEIDKVSRWADFKPTYDHVMQHLTYVGGKPKNGKLDLSTLDYKGFNKLRKRIFFDDMLPVEKERLLHELDAGNTEFVALTIAEHMASTKTQWLYGRHNRSFSEKSPFGRMMLLASVYPRSVAGQFMVDGKKFAWGYKTGTGPKWHQKRNYRMMMDSVKNIGGRLAIMALAEKMLSEIFGYKGKWSWGYGVVSSMTWEAGSLVTAPIVLASALGGGMIRMFDATGEWITGEIDEDERNEEYIRQTKNVLGNLDRLGMTTILNYRYLLGILESIVGLEDGSLKPFKNAFEMAIDEYEPEEVDRTIRQLIQKWMAGTGQTRTQYNEERYGDDEPRLYDPTSWEIIPEEYE